MLLSVILIILFAYALRTYQKISNGVCTSKNRLDGKLAIVTGGSRGMGLEIAKDFASRGARVIIACPFVEEGEKAKETVIRHTSNEEVTFKYLDLAKFESIRKFAKCIMESEEKLDILVCNAGGAFYSVSKDGLHSMMQVNFFGHVLLSLLLLPSLKKSGSSRIVYVCSVSHWFGQVNVRNLAVIRKSNLFRHYFDSKLCVLYFSNELRRRLKGNNIVVNTVDPGIVGTTIIDPFGSIIGMVYRWVFIVFFKSPLEGAQNAIYAAVDSEAGEKNGFYIKDCKPYEFKRSDLEPKSANIFWEECLKICKVDPSDICV